MRLDNRWPVGGLAVGLGLLSGWVTASAGGSVGQAPMAVLVMAVGLGGAGLVVGALTGRRKQATWWAALALLGSFYVGTWLNSPYHSPVGDAVVLVLAAIPTSSGTALGFAVGRYLATRRVPTHRM
ncbi:hypothetical protein GCM10027605_39860 [Micromonospora zhanjiangensis]